MGVERRMIRMRWGVSLGDRVSVIVKIEDMIIQSRLRWYGHVTHGDINS